MIDRIYKAEYEDGEFEIFSYCNNDKEAMSEAELHENEHGVLFNLLELNDDFDEIRTVY